VYYVPTRNPDPYPPALDNYLNSPVVTSKIGSYHTWLETNMDVYNNFAATGDWMRTSRPDLEKVINAGVRTVIYDGDADYIVNFKGIEAMVRARPPHIRFLISPCALTTLGVPQIASLNTSFSNEFARQKFLNFTVHGVPAGHYKNAGTFSYVRFFGAGHEVPAYMWHSVPRGAAALQMFTQIISGKQLSGT
jgi:carboxypeptidase C (cathepsin A)